MQKLKGIHHVTAITGNAQKNADFYNGVLGLRLVKKTVNFDDPGSYHLYYGDDAGSPGTLITFFAWPGSQPGRRGAGEPVAVAYEVPLASLAWWKERFATAGIAVTEEGVRMGEAFLVVSDPDGMQVELVERSARAGHAIQRIHSVTLALREEAKSTPLYVSGLGWRKVGADTGRQRFEVGEGADAGWVDIVAIGGTRGSMGAGTIHHVAFRTDDAASQQEWRERVIEIGFSVSPVMDRKYFESIYFREANGVLFEVATDGPGMAVDEPAETLGERLMLPREYEGWRTDLERTLPPLVLREGSEVRA